MCKTRESCSTCMFTLSETWEAVNERAPNLVTFVADALPNRLDSCVRHFFLFISSDTVGQQREAPAIVARAPGPTVLVFFNSRGAKRVVHCCPCRRRRHPFDECCARTMFSPHSYYCRNRCCCSHSSVVTTWLELTTRRWMQTCLGVVVLARRRLP